MSETTPIEWCDATLNLWWGCTKVSDGCKFCYAEHLADTRHKRGNWGPKGERREVKSWRSILAKVSKRAKAENRRLRVFCSSMSDVFEGPETMGGEDSENWVTVSRLRAELWEAIEEHHHLDFLLLTKRPGNVIGMVPWDYCLLHNVWIGTSIEDQQTADERIPHLLDIPAAVRFLSCEPLLGPVDISGYLDNGYDRCLPPNRYLPDIHWVIAGGESGPNARPMHPDWARSLRDQCNAADVPFLFKQWGEWGPYRDPIVTMPSQFAGSFNGDRWEPGVFEVGRTHMKRVGKKAAGRVLDGRTWDEFPVREFEVTP